MSLRVIPIFHQNRIEKFITENMKIYYVYILECSDKSYYTGITSNLTKRITEHQYGKYIDSYTYKRRPISLKFYADFTNVDLAIQTEKQMNYPEAEPSRYQVEKNLFLVL